MPQIPYKSLCKVLLKAYTTPTEYFLKAPDTNYPMISSIMTMTKTNTHTKTNTKSKTKQFQEEKVNVYRFKYPVVMYIG